jgi:hypothetical protein
MKPEEPTFVHRPRNPAVGGRRDPGTTRHGVLGPASAGPPAQPMNRPSRTAVSPFFGRRVGMISTHSS